MSQIYSRLALTPFHETSSFGFDKVRLDQYTPRALEHDSSFAYSPPDRRYEGLGWSLTSTVAPMSDQKNRGLYDVPAARVGDDYQTRPEISQRPPREQLPPLSSLFSAARPGGPAPYLEHSPKFLPDVSPQGHRRSSISVKSLPEPPSWEATNLQRHPSQSSSHYSYDGRPSQSTQSELPPPPPRQLQVNRQPNSPRFYESRFSPQDGSGRTQLPPSRSGWSPRSEPPYREYFPPVSRDPSSSLRPHLDQQQPLQPPSHKRESDGRQTYRETPLTAPATSQYPSTPASTSSDSLTAKDTLGPKIWTGTQFLPRYVRSAEVPGEGLCYFYDDGTHCKTHIDGEPVTSHWGVTKAGKPRKRLAIACITCREKKIKCDPDYPRCIQCEKFGRICKFKNAPRGGQGSPETPPQDVDDQLARPVSHRSDEEAQFKAEKRSSAHSIASQPGEGPASPELDVHLSKRRRYNDFSPLNIEAETTDLSQNASPTDRKSSGLMSRRSSEHLFAQWMTNPYEANEDLVMILMKAYFLHISSATYDMFPEKPFMDWLTDPCTEKSKDDLMLIYTMLALATTFSSNSEQKKLGETYAAISRYACDNRHFSLQLVQSRLLLALYYYANNNPNDSWDFCGSALRAATGMKLNQEIEKTDDSEREIFPFNLNKHGFAECRRRTFWSAYIIDRFNGFCSGHLSILHPEDIFLRLPCDAKSFNEQVEVINPFFDADTHPPQNSLSTIGTMGYLVNVASIWGDVMANVYRTSQRPPSYHSQNPSSFSSFYEKMTARLEAWHTSIPARLANTPENFENSARLGVHSIFITMHSLYHTTHIKLNRYVSPEKLTATQLEHNIRTAYTHANAMLRLFDKIATLTTVSSSDVHRAPCSSPFAGYAVISAVDIISAKGTVSALASLPGRFQSATKILANLSVFWQSARNQKEMMAGRVVDLCRVEEGWRDASVVKVDEDGESEKMWQMLVPMERTFAKGNDCIYAGKLQAWKRALEG